MRNGMPLKLALLLKPCGSCTQNWRLLAARLVVPEVLLPPLPALPAAPAEALVVAPVVEVVVLELGVTGLLASGQPRGTTAALSLLLNSATYISESLTAWPQSEKLAAPAGMVIQPLERVSTVELGRMQAI